jgi:hypothetical protein
LRGSAPHPNGRYIDDFLHRAGPRAGGSVGEGQRTLDCDTIERWAEAEGAGLENEAERAKAKFRNVDRARE